MALYIFVGYLVLIGDITVGSLVAVAQLMGNISIPIMEIIYGLNEMSETKNIGKEQLFEDSVENNKNNADEVLSSLALFIVILKDIN